MTRVAWYPGHELLLPDIVRAENCSLFDAAGRRYVDLESGVWCTSIGHAHPRILRTIARHVTRISHTGFGYSNPIVEQAAADVLALLGFDEGNCVFLCSGSEAVEYGVRVAQALSERPRMLTLADSYCGAYGSAKLRREDEWLAFDWLSGDADLDAIPFDEIGGFVFEPGSSSGLVRFPPESLIREIAQRVQRRGGLVMVNEVTTGLGRTGTWFGYQHYGLSPDIVALGKGVGNGYPVSVAAFARGLIPRLPGGTLAYAQSHQNDPLGAAIVREVLATIGEERLLERAGEIGGLLVSGLRALRERCDKLADVRARGLMAAVELRDDAATSRTIAVHRELVRRGYVIGRRAGVPVLRLDPSLTVEREDVEGFLETFGEVVSGV